MNHVSLLSLPLPPFQFICNKCISMFGCVLLLTRLPCLHHSSKGFYVCFLGERGRVIMLSASERMWSPVQPIDWRCWWITWNVQQAIRCCSVCRPVGWTAPIRPDIKRLCSITLEGALYACPMIKSMGSICHFSWGKARLQIIHAYTLSFNANIRWGPIT